MSFRTTQMALHHVAFIAISMVLLSSVAIATYHIVGDDKGWTVDFNYTQWAQDKVFCVGDNLGMKNAKKCYLVLILKYINLSKINLLCYYILL